MTARKALVIACLIITPGVALCVVPHLDRAAERRAGVKADTSSDPSQSPSSAGVPVLLSQRSTAALAFGLGIEVAMHIGLLTLLLCSASFSSAWNDLPACLRAFAGLLFCLLMTGFIGGTASTFPFVGWRMYSGDHDDVAVVYVLAVTTRDGVTREVDIDRLLPALGRHRLPQLLAQQARWVDQASDEVEHGARLELQRITLIALGRLYEAKNRDVALRLIALYVAHVPLDAAAPPWLRDRRPLRTVEVDAKP